MYSPKIHQELIPLLYREAKERQMPMTRLTSRIIKDHFERNGGEEDESQERAQHHTGDV